MSSLVPPHGGRLASLLVEADEREEMLRFLVPTVCFHGFSKDVPPC